MDLFGRLAEMSMPMMVDCGKKRPENTMTPAK